MKYEVYMAIHKLASIRFDEGVYDTLQEALEFSREDIESLLEGTLPLDEVDENTLEVFLDIPNWSIESRKELGTHWGIKPCLNTFGGEQIKFRGRDFTYLQNCTDYSILLELDMLPEGEGAYLLEVESAPMAELYLRELNITHKCYSHEYGKWVLILGE